MRAAVIALVVIAASCGGHEAAIEDVEIDGPVGVGWTFAADVQNLAQGSLGIRFDGDSTGGSDSAVRIAEASLLLDPAERSGVARVEGPFSTPVPAGFMSFGPDDDGLYLRTDDLAAPVDLDVDPPQLLEDGSLLFEPNSDGLVNLMFHIELEEGFAGDHFQVFGYEITWAIDGKWSRSVIKLGHIVQFGVGLICREDIPDSLFDRYWDVREREGWDELEAVPVEFPDEG